jgi:hypothetical protein
LCGGQRPGCYSQFSFREESDCLLAEEADAVYAITTAECFECHQVNKEPSRSAGYWPEDFFFLAFFQRASIACLAISFLRSGVRLSARFFARATAAGFFLLAILAIVQLFCFERKKSLDVY